MIKISYLVCCHNETDTLRNLLELLSLHVKGTNDEIVILDDFSDNKITNFIIKNAVESNPHSIKLFQHTLNNDYGTHKNYGNSKCQNEWIFQIDGDELPSKLLVEYVKDIIEANPTIDLFLLPRINDFKGVTTEHAVRWGWVLTPYKNGLIVNYPDYQGRIYKNDPKIKWERKLHEKIEGYSYFGPVENSTGPSECNFYLYHDKTIETQIADNLRYNKDFSEDDNRGHGGYAKTKA